MSGRRIIGVLLLLAAARAHAATRRPIGSEVAPLALRADADGEVVFVVAGDNRPAQKGAPLPRVLGEIFREIGLIRPDLVLWTGDAIYGYGDTESERDAEYEAFLRLARPAGVPIFNAPGNHEIGDPVNCDDRASERAFEKRWGRLYGSFDYAGAHFIALDTSEVCHDGRIEADQLEWLEKDLAENADARAIFVFTHVEFHSAASIDEDEGNTHPPVVNHEELHRLFLRYPVKAVFSGHEHLFAHETHDAIDYFVSGGAGAPIYAPPERGGFSHYLLVRLPSAGSAVPISYQAIEPGRLSLERANERGAFWVANANDASVPLRGLAVEVPEALGACPALAVEARGRSEPIPATIVRCERRPGCRRVVLSLEAPRRTSVRMRLSRKASGAPAGP